MANTKTLQEVEKAQTFNRLKDIISNSDNELKHMKIIKRMVEKFEKEHGTSNLSISLWNRYNNVNEVLKNN